MNNDIEFPFYILLQVNESWKVTEPSIAINYWLTFNSDSIKKFHSLLGDYENR